MLIGPPNTDNPKPQGRAIIIENLIAESILLFTISLSPAAYERIIDGTIAAANARCNSYWHHHKVLYTVSCIHPTMLILHLLLSQISTP